MRTTAQNPLAVERGMWALMFLWNNSAHPFFMVGVREVSTYPTWREPHRLKPLMT